MSAASGHTFSYVNKHGPPTMSRMSIDERYGRSWATHYSDSQQHLLATSTAGSGNSNSTSNAFYGVVSPSKLPDVSRSFTVSFSFSGFRASSSGRTASVCHSSESDRTERRRHLQQRHGNPWPRLL